MSSSRSAPRARASICRSRRIAVFTIQLLIAGVSLFGTGLAARWLVAEPVVATNGSAGEEVSFDDRFSTASFSERFQPAVDTPLAKSMSPVVMGGQVAWLDPSYSFGGRESFVRRSAPAPQVAVAAVQPKPADFAPIPAPREMAALVPMPASRPQELREAATPRSRAAYSHDVLVRRARTALAASAQGGKANWLEKLFGKEDTPPPAMAYASASPDDITGSLKTPDTPGPLDPYTAVYDITAKTVHMPDGSKLEAHSGLGAKMDKPAYAHVKMHGVTPPHIYDLKPREALFHGVAALRMTPLGGAEAIHNRTGLLAHNYLLGPNGDSNGCVSFKDYDRFLQAYNRGQVKRIVVVASLD